MPDVGALFDRARGLVDEAVASSGTTVTLYRDTGQGLARDVDPVTGELDDSAMTVLHAGIAGILVVAGPGGEDSPGEAVPLKPGDAKVILSAGITDVLPGDLVKVITSKEPRHVGTWWASYAWPDTSAGAARIGYAAPYRQGVGPA